MNKFIGNDWDDLLKEEFQKNYFITMEEYIRQEYKRLEIFPAEDDIFNALRLCSYADTKVVIVGQDLYINPGQAHGLSFSVLPGARIPPSLMNIFCELRDELGCYIPNNGCLIPWAKQGVLLLNSVLTVRRGCSNSHKDIVWDRIKESAHAISQYSIDDLIRKSINIKGLLQTIMKQVSGEEGSVG